MAVTIKDIAKAAKVSIATVSRALNGFDNVTDETRRHVCAVATRLGYIPHEGARSLSSRRTQCVGAVLPDLYGEFFSELIRGIDRVARTHGLHLLLSCSHGDVAEVTAALRAMRGRVDGLLVMSPHVDSEVLEKNLHHTMPTVLVNTRDGGERYSSLMIDNYGGACAMVRHLAGREARQHVAAVGERGRPVGVAIGLVDRGHHEAGSRRAAVAADLSLDRRGAQLRRGRIREKQSGSEHTTDQCRQILAAHLPFCHRISPRRWFAGPVNSAESLNRCP